MTLAEAVGELVGEYDRFGPMADRVEGLVDAQVGLFVPGRSSWLVLPWNPIGGVQGFYLLSEDREGQRRGREVLTGFLGPAAARIVTVPDQRLAAAFSDSWRSTGLVQASLIQRARGCTPDEMLARLEDAAATVAGHPPVESELEPNHVDLLRDFRLAMQARDPVAAQALLDQLVLTGELSAENLRFLTVELLASFGRWQEMAQLAYIQPLTVARRPRAVTESLLKMIWWTEVVPKLAGGPVVSVLAQQSVVAKYGGILRVIKVPGSVPGRILAFLTAVADNDTERRQAILRAVDDEERATLAALLEVGPQLSSQLKTEPEPELEPMRAAFDLGQYPRAVALFLADAVVDRADMAVESILELGSHERAAEVLQTVQNWVAAGLLVPGRRLKRDLQELENLVAGTCTSWVEWAERLASKDRWADAASVLRNQHHDWIELKDLTAAQVAVVADGILDALGLANEDQLRSSLDVLCEAASGVAGDPRCAPFCEVVLQLLSDQENVSTQVRESYVGLFAAILAAGPSRDAYLEILEQSGQLWDRIKSRNNLEWALELLEVALDESSPERDLLNAFGAAIVLAARSYPLTARQRIDLEALAPEFGLSALPLEGASSADDSVWSRLDGRVVGLYSLLGQAIPRFTDRVRALCNPGEVVGNSDKTATAALTKLAERADHLVVDTWHAAHQATAAIDAVRPRDQQILPRQRGVSGFMRALEQSLDD